MRLALSVFLITALCASAATATAPRVHRYTSGEHAFEANAYWLESDAGVVVVDSLFLKSDARRMAGAIRASGKPLAGILITHPHVDHFGGSGVLLELLGEAPVIATQATADAMRRVHDEALATGWVRVYGEDYAHALVAPTRIVNSGAPFELAGMRFELRDFGPGEAANNSVVFNPDSGALFVGDALTSGYVYYLGEGHSRAALQQLEAIEAAYPSARRAYPGHGGSAPLAALAAENRRQIVAMRDAVARTLRDADSSDHQGRLTPDARARLQDVLSSQFAGHLTYGVDAVPFFAGYVLPGLVAELRAEAAAERPALD